MLMLQRLAMSAIVQQFVNCYPLHLLFPPVVYHSICDSSQKLHSKEWIAISS